MVASVRIISISILILFIFFTASCDEMKIELSNNSAETAGSIIKAVPLGSDILRAEKIMKSNGFKCSYLKDSSFAEADKIYEHIDFLYCDKEKGFPVSRRWQAAIIHENSRVKKVLVSTGLTGP